MNKWDMRFLFLSAALLLLSCPNPVGRDDTEVDVTPVTISEETTLYDFDSDYDGIFSTNDSNAVDAGGATYWVIKDDASDTFSPVVVSMKKTSGYNRGGFGVIFSQVNKGTDDFSCLSVFINILGEYCIGLIDDNDFEYITDWTESDSLTEGYSQSNTVKIVQGDSAGTYELYLNGVLTEEFEDPSDEAHTGGGHGYITVVTPVENFPDVPVRVYFTEE